MPWKLWTLILLIVSFQEEIVFRSMKPNISGFFLLLTEFAMCCPQEEVSLHHRITKIFSHFFGKVYSFGFYI